MLGQEALSRLDRHHADRFGRLFGGGRLEWCVCHVLTLASTAAVACTEPRETLVQQQEAYDDADQHHWQQHLEHEAHDLRVEERVRASHALEAELRGRDGLEKLHSVAAEEESLVDREGDLKEEEEGFDGSLLCLFAGAANYQRAQQENHERVDQPPLSEAQKHQYAYDDALDQEECKWRFARNEERHESDQNRNKCDNEQIHPRPDVFDAFLTGRIIANL